MSPASWLLLLFILDSIAEASIGFRPGIAHGASLKNLFLIIGFAYLFLELQKREIRIRFREIRRINYLFIGFISYVSLVTVVGYFMGWLGNTTLFEAFASIKDQWLDTYLVFLIFFVLMDSQRKCFTMLKAFFVVMSILGLMTLLEGFSVFSLFGLDDDGSRPNGPIGEPNQTAAVYVLFILPMFTLAISGGTSKLFFGLGAVISAVTIAITSSRGGIIGLLAGFIVSTRLLRGAVRLEKKGALALVLVLGVFISLLILPDYYRDLLLDRFSILGSSQSDWSHKSAGRTLLWQWGIEAWMNSPILGSGWRSFNALTGHTSHNTYMEILVNAGVLGLVMYLMLLKRVIRMLLIPTNVGGRRDQFLLAGIVSGFGGALTSLFFVNLLVGNFVIWGFLGVSLSYVCFVKQRKAPQI